MAEVVAFDVLGVAWPSDAWRAMTHSVVHTSSADWGRGSSGTCFVDDFVSNCTDVGVGTVVAWHDLGPVISDLLVLRLVVSTVT